MYDSDKIVPGLIVFAVLITFPFWFNLGKAAPAPQLELPKEEKACLEATPYMRAQHMQLLNDWRTSVVRDANRVYVAQDGKEFLMSLQNTCIQCHTSKVKFCDRCHNYANVAPYCWDCHIPPKEEG